MKIAEFFVRKSRDKDGNTIEEPWVMIKKKNGRVIKKMRYFDYERTIKRHPTLSNRALLTMFMNNLGG